MSTVFICKSEKSKKISQFVDLWRVIFHSERDFTAQSRDFYIGITLFSRFGNRMRKKLLRVFFVRIKRFESSLYFFDI